MSKSLDNRVQVLFPEVYFQLQDECSFHPQLQIQLANHPATEFEVKLAEIAAYCGIVLDGEYSDADFQHVAALCITKLKQRAMDEATTEYLRAKEIRIN